MTYCVALNLEQGLVFASDSRTNAGVDDVRTVGKMRLFGRDGERLIVTLSSGNLSVTQNALNLLEHRARHQPDTLTLDSASSMYEVAQLIGDAMREVHQRDEAYLRGRNIDASGTFIVGGQLPGEAPRLFLVYSEGNFIEASTETPYFQTGEIKFGKPILDRVITRNSALDEATKCVVVSFDSTMRSNLSVGPPIDLLVYRRDSYAHALHKRLDADDPYLQATRNQWNDSLRQAVRDLPTLDWLP